MILKYLAQASFTAASGLVFNQFDEREVSEEIGKNLLETFIGMFEDVTPKAQPAPVAKPKAEPKQKSE